MIQQEEARQQAAHFQSLGCLQYTGSLSHSARRSVIWLYITLSMEIKRGETVKIAALGTEEVLQHRLNMI